MQIDLDLELFMSVSKFVEGYHSGVVWRWNERFHKLEEPLPIQYWKLLQDLKKQGLLLMNWTSRLNQSNEMNIVVYVNDRLIIIEDDDQIKLIEEQLKTKLLANKVRDAME